MVNKRFASTDEVLSCSVKCNIRAAVALLKSQGGLENVDGDGLERLRELCTDGGLVVGSYEDGTVQIAPGDSHSLIIGCSGRGKSRRVIIPTVETLILAGHNLVVNDMKGEIFKSVNHLLELMDYKAYVLDLRHPARSLHTYNPMADAFDAWTSGDNDTAARLLRNLASIIFSNSASSGAQVDPFWENSSIDYFTGLALAMLESGCNEDEFTLASVAAMDRASTGHPKGRSPLDKLFARLKGTLAYNAAMGTLGAPEDTKSSIVSVWRQAMSIYCSQIGLMRVLSRSSFDASVLAADRTAIFLVSPDEHAEVAPITTAILGQLMTKAIAIAEESDAARKQPVDFVLDEFGNLAKRIPSFGEVVSACRSRGVKLHLCVQSDAQLEHVYGKDLKGVVLGNIYNQVFLGTRDSDYLERFSKQLGEYVTPGGRTAPIMSRGQLQRLEKRQNETEAVILMESLAPHVAALPDYETICADIPASDLPLTSTKREAFDDVQLVYDIEKIVHDQEAQWVNKPASARGRHFSEDSGIAASQSIDELLASFYAD